MISFLESLHGDVFEIRIPKGLCDLRGTISGYFNDADKAARAIEQADLEFRPKAFYVTLNPVNPALLARSINKLKPYATETTADADIVRRRWLYVDIDPVRPSGTSATDAELQLALDLASHIKSTLGEAGWPEPIYGMSGNGANLLYRIDLPNSPESDALVSNILDNFKRYFSTDRVNVDTTGKNAARIVKVLGTWARKGDELKGIPGIEDRPHRQSWIKHMPDEFVEVPHKLLEEAARREEVTQASPYTGTERRLIVDKYLRGRGVEVKRTKQLPDGRDAWLLEHCPFNHEHGANGETAVFQWSNGKLGFECKHNSCQGNGWKEFRQAVGEPDADDWNPPKVDAPVLPGMDRIVARLFEDEPEPNDPLPQDPGGFPEELCNTGGLMGQIIDYTLSSSNRPQPVLALGGALALMSVITGRKVRDESGARTNMYILALAGVGGGKDGPRKANKEILEAAGATKEFAGPERIASASGLVSWLITHPSSLFQLDEFGKLLATTKNAKASPHLYNIGAVLLTLYSSAGQRWIGDAYADIKKTPEIYDPHCVIYGSTTKSQFYENLSAESVYDGLLSRMLVLSTNEDYPKLAFPKEKKPPASLASAVRDWMQYDSTNGNTNAEFPVPRVVPTTDSARELLQGWGSKIDERLPKDDVGEAAIWARAYEKAAKLALIHACSLKPADEAEIGEESVAWGIAMSKYLTRKMLFDISEWIAENHVENNTKRVLRVIRNAGRLTSTQLNRRTQFLRKRERDEILEDLMEANLIQKVEEETGGRPRVTISSLLSS